MRNNRCPNAVAQKYNTKDDPDYCEFETANIDGFLRIIRVQKGPHNRGDENGQPGAFQIPDEQGNGEQAKEKFFHRRGEEADEQGINPRQISTIRIAVLRHRRGRPDPQIIIAQNVKNGDVSQMGKGKSITDESDPSKIRRSPAAQRQSREWIFPAFHILGSSTSGCTGQGNHNPAEYSTQQTTKNKGENKGNKGLRGIVTKARDRIPIDGAEETGSSHENAHAEGSAPYQCALAIFTHEHDNHCNAQCKKENRRNIGEQPRTRANFPVIARKGFGHFEAFGKITRFIALNRNAQAVVPIIAHDKIFFAIRKGVIHSIGTLNTRRFDGFVIAELKALHIGQKGFRNNAGIFL